MKLSPSLHCIFNEGDTPISLSVVTRADGSSETLTVPPGEGAAQVHPGVWITTQGEVVGRKPCPTYGYLRIGFGGTTHLVHRLMAEHFLGIPENTPIVRHLNDVKDDNRLENLAWGTHSDNLHDAVRNGKKRHRNWSTLSRKQVIEARRRVRAGERLCDIVDDYPVQYPALVNAVRGNTWADVSEEPPVPPLERKASAEERRKAVRLFAEGKTADEVGILVGRDRKTILNWAHAAGVRKYKT